MEDVKKYFKENSQNTLKDNYIKACSDEVFQNYVHQLPIKEEVLVKYTSSLEECVKQRKKCMHCPGLKECPQEVKGFVLTPEQIDKRVIFSYVACSKKQSILYKDNVTYFDVSKDIRNASLKEVYTDDKGRVPIIKYFNDFMKKYGKEDTKGLYLTGSFGTGKTYLISALLNDMAKKNIKSTIVYYPEFLRELKSSFGSDFDEKYNAAKKSPILFIDDIGAESITQWTRDEILLPVLDERMNKQMKTYFTSNYSMEELEQQYRLANKPNNTIASLRILGRIRTLSKPVELSGKSRR